ncbi:hypothetical protein ACFL27_27990 [candidate division CSSED10-310 bacterium]|uniref:Tyr recombinase domain-containing protein n=1 Tax=candidate division CSSED10-310 bacterium TaxID=2855610 RepID=A0ABV6Z6H7_UNCC1
MSLEQVYKATWTLRSLRSGPLGHLTDSFCDWLLSKGFAGSSIRLHLGIISHLNEYLNDLISKPVTLVTAQDIEGFLASYPSRCRCRVRLEVHLRRVCFSISRFTEFLNHQGLFDSLVSPPPGNNCVGPRIHDLRHTFAVHRLLAWYHDGHDVNARLPALATYMGHVDISSTQVYLRPTAELLGEVHRRFHSHYREKVEVKGERS